MRRILAGLLALLLWASPAAAQQVRVFLTTSGTWTVPADWNSNGATIEAIGGGGGGSTNGLAPGGAGGGAYAKNYIAIPFTAGQVVTYSIGAAGVGGASPTGGGDTWFSSTSYLKAAGGSDGRIQNGGTIAASIGDVRYGGGNGNSSLAGGGGGAAGPNGNGNGALLDAGGSGDAGFGGAGGTGSPGTAGQPGTEWDASHGSGGGGGGNTGTCVAGAGGNYGGGGGTGWNGSVSCGFGNGKQGIIVITYTPPRRISSGVF